MPKNPFLKTQINSAFEKTPDVEQIHQQLTTRILNTIPQIRDQGSVLQLLIGAPGSGKTHLLARLWKLSSQRLNESYSDPNTFLFVSVPPPGDITRIYLHILREVVSSLLQKFSSNEASLTPLDLFITEILRKILIDTLPENQSSIIDTIKSSKPESLYHLLTKSENRTVFISHCLKNFNQVFPNIDIQLFQAMFALLDPFRKPYILKWFQPPIRYDSHQK